MLKMILGGTALVGAGFLLAFSSGVMSQRTAVGSTRPVQLEYAQQSTGQNRTSPVPPSFPPPPQFKNQLANQLAPAQQSFSAPTVAPPKTPSFPEHEWLFVTKSDELLCGDFIEPIELDLKFEYGTAKIPLADIVSISRVEIKKDDPNELPTAFSPSLQNAPPEHATTAEETEAKKEVGDEPKTEDKPAIDNQIVVATKNGNILVGQCDLADFHVRTSWGTMTIDASRVKMISSKSSGLKRLQQANSEEGWMLKPLRFMHHQIEVQGDDRQALFSNPPNRLFTRPSS